MKTFKTLVAMVALCTCVTAAQIKAGQPEFNSLSSVLPSLSLATADEFLRVPIATDLAIDDRMIAASLSSAQSGSVASLPFREPTLLEFSGIGLALVAIVVWRRRALHRSRRRYSARRKRTQREMAWI